MNTTVTCYSTARSKITHASGTEGNESVIAREAVLCEGEIGRPPYLSANALRHVAVREPGYLWLIDALGLRGKLTLAELNFLLNGGTLTKGGGKEELGRIARGYEAIPLLRLLGGAIPSQIVAGCLAVGRGVLVCRENTSVLKSILPAGWIEDADELRPSEDFVTTYQYVRSDIRTSAPEHIPSDAGVAENELGIFAGQALIPGSGFVHTFAIRDSNPVLLGALILSLRLWRDGGGRIGGQSARGHGSLDVKIHCEEDVDSAVDAYADWALSHAKEASDWLHDTIVPRPAEKPSKKRKAAEAAEAEVEE